MKTIYKILIGVLIVLLIYIFSDWIRTFIINSLGGYTTKEVVTDTKIKYKQGKIDTIAVFDKYVKTRGINLNPKPKIVIRYDTIYDTIKKTELKEFEVAFKDSLIDGKMTIRNYFNGNLESAFLNYKPLFPKYIRRTDTIYKTTIITETLSKERAKFGVGVGTDTEFSNLDLLGSYTLKNGLQVMYEYSNPIQDFNVNIPQLNFQNYTFPRKGKHNIKVIYNF